MLRNHPSFLLLLIGLVLLGTVSCDNVGRAFDRSVDPSDPTIETGTSAIQIVPVGGVARDGRPQVRQTYPEGAGWPGTVPIVVEFSESINEATMLPSTPTGIDARIGVRVQGTNQLLPAQYDLLANGRLLIIRPVNGLQNAANAIYEVVLLPEGRDVDGVRFQVSGGETVLSDFQVNQDESVSDGAVVAVYPRDNFSDQQREGDFFVVFDRPANASTLVDSNLFLQASGGAAVSVDINVVLTTVGIADSRVVQIDPTTPLASSTVYEFTVTESITFGADGRLDFNGRTPFSVFDTIGPLAPTGVELGNAVTGFPNKINRQNALNVMLSVDTAADTLVGDLVVGRIYGGDASTTQTFDLTFIERTATTTAAGQQTVLLDFGAQLGTLASPSLDDGSVTFAAQIQRGGRSTGFIHNSATVDPSFDVTSPTLVQAGPPGSGTDIYTEDESLAYYGVASEGLEGVTLVDGVSPTATLFGSDAGGRFLVLPVPLGRLTSARGYTVVLTDLAGNVSETAIAGNIWQRGQVTGTLAGTLKVEAYDHATLLPIEGATVLVDPAIPTVPAVGQLVGTTGPDGTVSFATALGAHTITIIRTGYDLVTMYDTQAAHVSLPLSPLVGATATLRGTAALVPTPGATAIIGSTAVADSSVLGIRTDNATPTRIPATAIVPNRAQVVTGFGGSFEATSTPTYAFQGCQMCGVTLLSPTAPVAPTAPGEEVSTTVVLSTAVTPLGSLLGAHSEDFGLAVGLDVANLVAGSPSARVTASLFGFTGQALTGIGSVTLQSGTTYDIDANFALPIIAVFGGFSPVSWLVTEAQDTAGRVSRTRVLLIPAGSTIVPGIGPSPIPTITAPSGAFAGSPLVMHVDVLNAAAVPAGLGFTEVTASDASGRRWHIIVTDRDAAGATDTVQFPDLATANVAGLDAGAWQMVVEARLVLSVTSSIDDIVLTERFRQEVNYVRSAPVTFTIQ